MALASDAYFNISAVENEALIEIVQGGGEWDREQLATVLKQIAILHNFQCMRKTNLQLQSKRRNYPVNHSRSRNVDDLPCRCDEYSTTKQTFAMDD